MAAEELHTEAITTSNENLSEHLAAEDEDQEVANVDSASCVDELLQRKKEPSCPGSLLVSTGSPLGESITMLGGMLAHPYIGIYPYRDGPAETIVAARLAAPGTGVNFPADLRSVVEENCSANSLDLIFIVSNISAKVFENAVTFNVVHHPWCYPHAKPGESVGANDAWQIGLHVPEGGEALTSTVTKRAGQPALQQRDADPESAVIDSLAPTRVFVHPGGRGELCCSPNNVRVKLVSPKLPIAVLWVVCTKPREKKKSRSCVSLHWLISDSKLAKTLATAADEATCLGEFLATATSELGSEAPAVREASVAFGVPGPHTPLKETSLEAPTEEGQLPSEDKGVEPNYSVV